MMINAGEGLDTNVEEVSLLDYIEKMNMVYPKDEAVLIEFMNMSKIKGFKVIIYPRCSLLFYKEATKYLEKIKPQQPWKVS